MKKALVALAIAALASSASAAVLNSPHDLTNTGPWSALNGQLSACQFCHAPHNVNTQYATPLWNRNNAVTASFQMYTSATLHGSIPTTPNANSMTCLSCHDGATDLGATYTGSPGFTIATTWSRLVSNYPTVASGNLGSDLRNDHPVSVPYVETNGGAYNLVNNIQAAGIRLYTYSAVQYVECASCHDPHNYGTAANDLVPFLRTRKAVLCTTCHNY